MKLSEELQERGFIYQYSNDDLGKILDGPKRTVYLGIDPTASSIHVGNLVPYMLLNRLMQAGHKVILLMGGATALIGDPGGKNEERPFVEAKIIAEQAKIMEAGIRKFVTGDVLFVNNYDWLSKLSMIDYLRNVGKYFTVNAMIKKDIVANRLTDDNSISYTEFSYSLLQGYDYYHLHTEYGCDLQIGGSDQWSNILSGVEYIRKTTGDEVFALTMPLVVDKSTGKKFGKSEGNAVWLDADKTSPYQFYQFWLNTADESVSDYLKIFTFLSLEEIANIARDFEHNPEERGAQKRLAYEVTKFIHGVTITESIQKVSSMLFGNGLLSDLSSEDLVILTDNAPVCDVKEEEPITDILVRSELASSKREARTFIESGAIILNEEKVSDTDRTLTHNDLNRGIAILKRGKKKMCVLQQK